MAWWKRDARSTPETTSAADLPVIRLQGVTRIFKGDADEPPSRSTTSPSTSSAASTCRCLGPSGCGKSTLLSVLA